MKTLIIPCAGHSNRFPNMKPKYMLTHPDGKLMIEKAMMGLNTEIFDRIIITIVKPHDENYESGLVLSQVFSNKPKVEICILNDFTSSASETIAMTIEKMNVSGQVVIKDSDNCVHVQLPNEIKNEIVGYDLRNHPEITNIPGKSFLIINNQNIIQDIIEKHIVSNIICLGVYCFSDISDFQWAYKQMKCNDISGEMYISHVISFLISHDRCVFDCIMAKGYDDWGTLTEWKRVQHDYRTYFIDVDGVILKNSGKYGSINWSNNDNFLNENVLTIKQLQKNGAQIVITTSRTEEYRQDLERMLLSVGIKPYAIIMGMNHAARVIINDFAPTNPYPSGIAITLPRNTLIKDYLD